MRILTVHNYYQQRGGEDEIFETEARLLENYGHHIVRFTVHNDAIADMGKLEVARHALWNREVFENLRALIRAEQPDVVHFHNTFPLVSPAAYYAVRAEGIPIIQTINNYRLLCPKALFFRNGSVCEDCLGKTFALPGVVHACYRNSRAASTTVAALTAVHKAKGTWQNLVDVYILALTEFAREKFIAGGLPAEKLVVKPNFVYPDPGPGSGSGNFALFVGRLSKEKGIQTLLDAWTHLKQPLHIVGDGPLADTVAAFAEHRSHVTWHGHQPAGQVYDLMGQADCLVFPSVWYEGLPRTIVEAFAKGTPVIASDLGAMSSLITHEKTGLHFAAGQPDDLVTQVESFWSRPSAIRRMRTAARKEYENRYTAAHNYNMLMDVYDQAIHRNPASRLQAEHPLHCQSDTL